MHIAKLKPQAKRPVRYVPVRFNVVFMVRVRFAVLIDFVATPILLIY